MKNRFKTMSGALALTFMLLFGAVAFAHTTNTSMANLNRSASEKSSARNERLKLRRRHHRRRHHMRRWEKREMRRERKGNR